jgi:hypothetical protein
VGYNGAKTITVTGATTFTFSVTVVAGVPATPATGTITATGPLQATISHTLSGIARRRHRRLGTGRLVQLRFQNSENNQRVEIYGYELPFHELGRR